MQKHDLDMKDKELVAAAVAAVKKPIRQPGGIVAPALVGAAVCLDNGEIVTAVNLVADVGSLSMCAEPLALAEANKRTDRQVKVIVAVYCEPGKEPKVVPPCGRCREFMTDFAPGGLVILRDPGSSQLFKTRAADLLPLKYGDYWKDGGLT